MNFNFILIRYGELTTKKKNRNNFITILYKNIKNKLINFKYSYKIFKEFDRLFIEIIKLEHKEKIIQILRNIFGIYSISLVTRINKDINIIVKTCLDFIIYFKNKKFNFKIHRNDKNFFLNSIEIKKYIISEIIKNPSIYYNYTIKNYEILIEIEIRKNYVYIFIDRIKTLGGLPVGVSGRGIVLLSGGIDSPVASFLTMKRGMNIQYLYFFTPPYTDNNTIEKIKNIIIQLIPYSNKNYQILHIVNFTLLQNEIMHISKNSYRIIIMRRMFYRIANILAQKIGYQAIITGESLGQVASQTIESINIISDVVNLPIIRPVICFDKINIIDIAKQINTYKISILPFIDCCSLFVPKKPVIKPKKIITELQENKIIWQDILNMIINNHITTYIIQYNGTIKKINHFNFINKIKI